MSVTKQDLKTEQLRRVSAEAKVVAAQVAMREWQARALAAEDGADGERDGLEKRLAAAVASLAKADKAAEAMTQKAEAKDREIANLKDALADIEAQRDGWQSEQKGLAKVVNELPTASDVQERDAKIEDLNAALSAERLKVQSIEKALDKERQYMAKRLAKVEAALAKAEAAAQKEQETAKRAREALAVRPDVVELGRLRAELNKMQREASVG